MKLIKVGREYINAEFITAFSVQKIKDGFCVVGETTNGRELPREGSTYISYRPSFCLSPPCSTRERAEEIMEIIADFMIDPNPENNRLILHKDIGKCEPENNWGWEEREMER